MQRARALSLALLIAPTAKALDITVLGALSASQIVGDVSLSLDAGDAWGFVMEIQNASLERDTDCFLPPASTLPGCGRSTATSTSPSPAPTPPS